MNFARVASNRYAAKLFSSATVEGIAARSGFRCIGAARSRSVEEPALGGKIEMS